MNTFSEIKIVITMRENLLSLERLGNQCLQ